MARKKSDPRKVKPAETVPPPAARMVDLPAGYAELLTELKDRIRTAQVKASLAINRELIGLYWHIGQCIVARQQREGWGKGVIDLLARDLQREFPGTTGFSPGNLWRMRAFYLAYEQEVTILAQAARELTDPSPPAPLADIPWFHNVVLIEKLKDPAERLWYARKTIENGWSRNVLVHQIETDLYRRQGKAITNFDRTLPAPQSDLAQQLLKDPYTFDFLTLAEGARERDLEQGLLRHLRDFLLELGVGFALVGSQYRMKVGGEDYPLDLLFYHLRLRCFVVIDLKMEAFQPGFVGQMNFYLSVVDDRLRHPGDGPSLGLILCKTRNRVVVEYALRDLNKPMGVASYEHRRQALPDALRDSLPSAEQLQAELERAESEVKHP